MVAGPDGNEKTATVGGAITQSVDELMRHAPWRRRKRVFYPDSIIERNVAQPGADASFCGGERCHCVRVRTITNAVMTATEEMSARDVASRCCRTHAASFSRTTTTSTTTNVSIFLGPSPKKAPATFGDAPSQALARRLRLFRRGPNNKKQRHPNATRRGEGK